MMQARITKAFTFEAAHRLPWVPPEHKCSRLHGHNYRVEVTLLGAVNPATGFVADFFDIEARVRPLVDKLDHRCLNHIEDLLNPTAENIAGWFVERLADMANLEHVRVYENADCWAQVDKQEGAGAFPKGIHQNAQV
jgi:6-pyruvoyltetrahydropterin/6-carboxytetrahydropterin synthase